MPTKWQQSVNHGTWRALIVVLATAACSSGAPATGPAEQAGPAGAGGDETECGDSREPHADGRALPCPPGALGCPCDDGTCSQGRCSADSSTCIEEQAGMVHVPAGPFWMGCREGVDTDAHTGPCSAAELPFRRVTVGAFWIDRTEVTKGDYRRCMESGACARPPRWDAEWYQGSGVFVAGRDDMPAASVTWTQARDYCEWIGKRLPTAAEWEKAARGTDGRKYPWGMAEPTCEHANFRPWDVAAKRPGAPCPYRAEFPNLTPVAMFCGAGASVYGACDMAGNVAEWVADGYDRRGYGDLPATDPMRPPDGELVTRRGAGWGAFSVSPVGYSLRTSRHKGGGKDDAAETLESGFRCARAG